MPDGIELPISSASAPRYRYYTVNIVTNKVIGEIPFEDVNYERSVKSPGAFDGKITITDQTNDLDLYNSTLPGKTALYVVRNNEAVWGGIIWGRTYDLVGRSLAVSASEFTSYLSHRIVWKTYSHSFTAKLTKPTSDSHVRISLVNKMLKSALSLTDSSGNPTLVTVNFTDNDLRKYNGEYAVEGIASTPSAPADPGLNSFYVSIPALPPKAGIYDGVGVTLKADTYDYLRDLVTSTLKDFIDIEFPNEVIEPGIKEAVTVETKQLTLESGSNVKGVATLTTSDEHELTVGQRVTIANVDLMLDGLHKVSEIPNKFTFKYVLDNPVSAYDNTTKIYLDTSLATPQPAVTSKDIVAFRQVDPYLKQNITQISRVSGITTLTFDGVHNFEKNQKIVLTIDAAPEVYWWISTTTTSNGKKTTKKVKTNTFDYKKWNYTVVVTSATEDTVTYVEPKYTSATYDKTFNTRVLADNYAKSSEPVPALTLYPTTSSGYSIGDSVYVDGVDQPQWPYSLYDGYQKIYDVSSGSSVNISSYYAAVEQLDSDTESDDAPYMVVTYLCDTNPEVKTGDQFEVSGITSYPILNGRFTALQSSEKVDTKWSVKVHLVVNAISLTNQSSGAALTKDGNSWIAYKPSTSELRYSMKTEPDNLADIENISYTKSGKTVTLTTKARHNFRVGDRVKITFSKVNGDRSEDQKYFGGTVTVTGVGDLDSISYKIFKSEHKLFPPPANVKSTSRGGTITAVKSSTTISPSLDIPVQGIRADAPVPGKTDYNVTVYSTDNDLKVGDYVSTAYVAPETYADDNYSGFGTYDVPVKVTEAASNYFRYSVGGPAFSSDSATIYKISYTELNTAKTTADNVVVTISKSSDFNLLGTVTITVATPGVFTLNNHGLVAGQKISLTTTGALPTGLTVGTTYYIISTGLTTNTFRVSATSGGSAINTSGTQSGVHTLRRADTYTNVSSVSFANKSLNQITVTTDAPHGWVSGRKVTLSGFPQPGSTFRASTTTNVDIIKISHQASSASAIVEFSSAHGLNAIDDIGARLRVSNAADSISYPSETTFINGLPLASWLNTTDSTGHYISQILSPTEVMIPIMDFSYDWVILAAGLTETNGHTSILTEGKNVYDNIDYSKLNFTAEIQSVPSSTTMVIQFPAADDDSYPTTYTPSAGTVKAYSSSYKNMSNNQPSVGDLFSLSGFNKIGAIDYSYLNLDGYTVLAVANVTNEITKLAVTLKNPKVGKVRPKYDAVTFNIAGGFPKFNRALPISGNAYLNQSPLDSTESRNSYTINKVTRVIGSPNTTATVYLTSEHNIIVGDSVVVDMFRDNYDAFTQNYNTVEVTAVTSNSISYTMSSPSYAVGVSYAKDKFVTIYLDSGNAGCHDYAVGDSITVGSATSSAGGTFNYGNSNFTIVSVSATSITYIKSGGTNHARAAFTSNAKIAISRNSSVSVTNVDADGILSKAPTIYKRPVVFRKTYGEFPSNAEIGGISFSTLDYSNKNMPNSPIFGSDLQTVAEILDKYSNGINGFEYRIDPGLTIDETGTKVFTRKFVLIPIYPQTLTDYLETLPGGKLARGQVANPSAFGADKVIFEYPGNITNVSMAEKAETSATRIFVRSGDGKAGSGTEVAYSAAADTDLLQDNWPLLDKKESVTWPLVGTQNVDAASSPTNTDNWGNHDDETDYHKSALRFLKESKPPAGDFVIDVNGSVTPVIGSYNPGDWCSIIINDNFVKTRLNSVLEPRKDVIVRKIDAIKVAVPNNPAFPEKISLTLIPDWQVDAVGK